MLVSIFMECRTSSGSQKYISPLAPALYVNKILRLIFPLALRNKTKMLIFIKTGVCRAL